MSSEIAISVQGVSKSFKIYATPGQRLRQMLWNGLARFAPTSIKDVLHQRAHIQADEFVALNEVSFEVLRGQTVGIIGRNGSGKSTLLQIICGTLAPTTGNVYINGRVAALLELGSGFNPEYTGRENVYFNAQLLGLTRKQVEERFDDIVEFADIGDFLEQPVKTYSSGMYVRLAFAVIAHVDADLLIIDEALAVGDAFFTQKCMRFLRNFMLTNTVLFVSHDTGAIKNLCTYALWLEKGKVLERGLPKDVADQYLQAFYEAKQGKSTQTRLKPDFVKKETRAKKDQRLAFLNASNLRNDLKVMEFDPQAAAFGAGGATITSVEFAMSNNDPLSWIVGGEEVKLRISAQVHKPLLSPIIGFYIKDKLGQNLFGDNTHLSYIDTPVPCESDDMLMAEFGFQMPMLAKGDYSVSVAIADGTQDAHEQQHWIHDALMFRSEATSVASGLLGIPMHEIVLFKDETHLTQITTELDNYVTLQTRRKA
jgi:lipopolysaccharide transport system ATP-binding protein